MQEAILSLNARGRAKGHILAFLTVFVWGITFVSTKVLLTVVTPIEILFCASCWAFSRCASSTTA